MDTTSQCSETVKLILQETGMSMMQLSVVLETSEYQVREWKLGKALPQAEWRRKALAQVGEYLKQMTPVSVEGKKLFVSGYLEGRRHAAVTA